MSCKPSIGQSIQLFLVDGKPSGLRKATIHGWTGLLFVSDNATFTTMAAREELKRTGVYILFGPDPGQLERIKVYIGSANSVEERIKESAEKRSFWENAISITTSDDVLSKGHVEYLEARLIELTSKAARVSLDNSTNPDAGRRRLPEADTADMERFLRNVQVVLPLLGLDMMKPQPKAVTEMQNSGQELDSSVVQFEIPHKSEVKATAVEEEGEFIVLKGSEALTETGQVLGGYGALKEKLVNDGTLKKLGNKLQFTKSYAFRSPSAAAAIVLDRNSNGRKEWKVQGSKKTYHEWQEAQAQKESETAAK